MKHFSLPFWNLLSISALIMLCMAYYQDTTVLHLQQDLHLTADESYAINGVFAGALYLSAAICSIVSGRKISSFSSCLLGLLLVAIALSLSPLNNIGSFLLSISLFSLGYGLVYTNVFYLIGKLLEQQRQTQDGGFTLAYTALNVGALFGLVLGGYAIQSAQFALYCYGLAALVLLSTFAIYKLTCNIFSGIDSIATQYAPVIIYSVLFVAVLWLCLYFAVQLELPFSLSCFAIIIALFVIAFIRWRANPVTGKKLFLLAMLVAISIFYWAAYRLQDNFILNFIQQHVTRTLWGHTIPAPSILAINPLFILIAGPLLVWFYGKQTQHPSNPVSKVGISLFLLGVGFGLLMLAAHAHLPANLLWVIGFLLLLSGAEVILGPTSFSMINQLADERDQLLMFGLVRGGLAVASVLAGQIAIMANNHLVTQHHVHTAYSHVYCIIAIVLCAIGLPTWSARRIFYRWN